MKIDVAGVGKDGGHIAGHEVLTVAEPDDDGRAVTHGHQLVWILGGEEHQGEQPSHAGHGSPHGALQAIVLPLFLDQVRDDLGVGLRLEHMPFGEELAFQIEVVLDDPVVDDDDPPRAVAMRVSVLLGRPAVSRPPGVPQAVLAIQRAPAHGLFEIRELAGAATDLHAAVIDDGDAGRVVAAILQALQPVEDDWNDRFRSDVTDDAAHS